MKFLQIDANLAVNVNAINSIEVRDDKVIVYWKELTGGDKWELQESVCWEALDKESAQEHLRELLEELNQ